MCVLTAQTDGRCTVEGFVRYNNLYGFNLAMSDQFQRFTCVDCVCVCMCVCDCVCVCV